MGGETISPTVGAGGFKFGETYVGDQKDAWVTALPPDLKAAFDKLDSAPPEKRAELAEALVKDGLAAFDKAAKEAGVPDEQAALWREAVEDSLRGSAGTVFMNRISAEKIKGLSIEELMFFVMSERTKNLDRQIRGFADEIQNRNNLMQHANGMLSQARNMYAGLDKDESAAMPAEMVQFFKSNGISLPKEEGRTTPVGEGVDVDQAITESTAALTQLGTDRSNADNACIKHDVSDTLMTYCTKHGIEVPNNGKGLQKKDFDTLEGRIDKYKAELGVKKENIEAFKASNKDGKPADPSAAPVTLTRDQWDAATQNIKGFLEGLNNQSELDMIKYQSVMSKYTSGIEMLSNTMKKLADNQQAVVRNMG
jgi:hypothetical protein